MPLVIPDIQNITNGTTGLDFQSVEDGTDQAAINAAIANTAYVVSGMQVTQNTGSNMLVSIAAGKFVINGTDVQYAGGTATIGAASTTDRRDIISINASGTVTVTAGTACGTAGWTRTSTGLPPVKAAIPANNVLLGEVGVTSTTTVITTAVNVVDKTVVRAPTVGVGTPNSSAQSLTAGTAALITGTSIPLGSGELIVGTQFRITVGVTKTAAGIAAWTAAVKFGTANTTSDAAIATFTSGTNTALADQGTLQIVITITAVGSGTSATAVCLAFWSHGGSQATGLGSMTAIAGSTAGFNSTATNPFFHVDITAGTSAVMTAWGISERLG